MNDRELLELAAKAAGSDLNNLEFNKFIRTETMWNPLTDDGDALRLVVKLHINLFLESWQVVAETKTCGGAIAAEATDADYSLGEATRRAIVRAAAEIGKTK